MAKTNVTDAIVKQYTGNEIKGNINNAIGYIQNGNIKKTFVTLEDLENYNSIDNYNCVFGAKTDFSFQYEMIVKVTNHTSMYTKDCKKCIGVDEHGKKILETVSTIGFEETSITKLYSLASYGFKVEKVNKNTFYITSPYYKKLTAFRRIIDNIEDFFKFEDIRVNRYKNKIFCDMVALNGRDVIKECQHQNRGFWFREISARLDKAWN